MKLIRGLKKSTGSFIGPNSKGRIRKKGEFLLFQTSVGVDLNSERIAVVCLKKTLRGVRLLAHSLFPLNKEKPIRERLEGFAEGLAAFLQEHQVNGRGGSDIFLGLPRELAVVKEIQLPLAAKENLHSAVRFDLGKHVPLPEDEIWFDCRILSENKAENQLHILLVIAKKQDMMLYFEPMESIGRIAGIDLSSAGLVNFLDYFSDGEISENEITETLRNRNGGTRPADITGSGLPNQELVSAYGLALKGLTHVPVDLNLIPPPLRKKPSRLGIYTALILAVLLLLSLLSLGGSYFIQQTSILKNLDARLIRLKAEISDLDRIRQRTEQLEERLSYLSLLRGNNISVLDILRELTRVIPETAWVQNLSYLDRKVQLDGYAETATELIPLLEASPMFRNVVFLSSITRTRDGKERFRIGLETNP